MPRPAWGHHTDEMADEARERIVDGAERAIRRWGIARTRIEDIAEEARCGRSTLYRWFANKESVVVEVLLRQGRRYGDTLMERLRSVPDTPEKVVEGVVLALQIFREDEGLRWVIGTESLPVAVRIDGLPEALFQLATSIWMEMVDRDPVLKASLRPEVAPALAAEWIVRATLTYVAYPGPTGDDLDALRAQLRLVLLPALFRDDEVPAATPLRRRA